MAGTHKILIWALVTFFTILVYTTGTDAEDLTCSNTAECTPSIECSASICNCSIAAQQNNGSQCAAECDMTVLLAEPCCCDFLPECIAEQQVDHVLHIRATVVGGPGGYQQSKADIFLLKDGLYIRVSSIILATLNCDVGGSFDAIQIIQPGEVCDGNVTDAGWPSYSDWELNEEGETVYPPGEFANESDSCHANAEWSCNGGFCAYTSGNNTSIVNFDPSDHYDWCGDTNWTSCNITTSSSLTDGYSAELAQLDRWEPGMDGGWAPALYDTDPFIQIHFGETREVAGVVTQGMATNFERRIDAFHVAYVDDGDDEIFLNETGGARKTFNTGMRYKGKAVVIFDQPITTSVIKLVVVLPESLYLIGGRVSAVEFSELQKNEQLWDKLNTPSVESFAIADRLLSSDEDATDWSLSSQNDHHPFEIPSALESAIRKVVAPNLTVGESWHASYENFEISVSAFTTTSLCKQGDVAHDALGNEYVIPTDWSCGENETGADGEPATVWISWTTFTSLADIVNQILAKQASDDRVVSNIVDAVVYTGGMSLSGTFRFTLAHTKDDIDNLTSPRCEFWNETIRAWDSSGCVRIVTSHTDNTSCECDHMTSFAILMNLKPDLEVDIVGEILTKLGIGLSIGSLVLSLFVFFFLRSSLATDRVSIHINLMIAILIADIIFICGIDSTEVPIACRLVAFSLHFFYEAVLCWMLIEGVHLYRQIIRVFESERPRTWIYYLIGWGVPAVIVIVSGAIKHDEYGNEHHCWLASPGEGGTAIWAFIGPAIPILMTNVVVLLLVVKTVVSASGIEKEKGKINQVRAGVRSSILLLPLLGVPWLLGPFATFGKAWGYFFTFFNTLQGLFISLFYCFLNSEVRGIIEQRVRKTRESQNPSVSNSSEDKKGGPTVTTRRVRVSPAPMDSPAPALNQLPCNM